MIAKRLRWGYLVPWAATSSAWFRMRSHKLTFPQVLARYETDSAPAARSGPRPEASTVARAVELATSVWPFRTTCIIRCLVLARLLRRFGYPATLTIGVSESGTLLEKRFAHAWVESSVSAAAPGFSEIVRFSL